MSTSISMGGAAVVCVRWAHAAMLSGAGGPIVRCIRGDAGSSPLGEAVPGAAAVPQAASSMGSAVDNRGLLDGLLDGGAVAAIELLWRSCDRPRARAPVQRLQGSPPLRLLDPSHPPACEVKTWQLHGISAFACKAAEHTSRTKNGCAWQMDGRHQMQIAGGHSICAARCYRHAGGT